MDDPVWAAMATVLAAPDEQLAENGGQAGVRDAGLLESAVARPQNSHSHRERSLPVLAAHLAFDISWNGNRRTSLVVADLFLELNDLELAASDEGCIHAFLGLAEGERTEERIT